MPIDAEFTFQKILGSRETRNRKGVPQGRNAGNQKRKLEKKRRLLPAIFCEALTAQETFAQTTKYLVRLDQSVVNFPVQFGKVKVWTTSSFLCLVRAGEKKPSFDYITFWPLESFYKDYLLEE